MQTEQTGICARCPECVPIQHEHSCTRGSVEIVLSCCRTECGAGENLSCVSLGSAVECLCRSLLCSMLLHSPFLLTCSLAHTQPFKIALVHTFPRHAILRHVHAVTYLHDIHNSFTLSHDLHPKAHPRLHVNIFTCPLLISFTCLHLLFHHMTVEALVWAFSVRGISFSDITDRSPSSPCYTRA
jgi:hypothetical protein